DDRELARQKRPGFQVSVEPLRVSEQHGRGVILRIDAEAHPSEGLSLVRCRDLQRAHALGDARTNRGAMSEEKSRDPNLPAQRLRAHRTTILIEQREGADLPEVRQRLSLFPTAESGRPERE